MRVQRAANHLYILRLNLAVHACLLAKVDDPVWLWHMRLGHLHFRAVNAMSKQDMVHGMPRMEHIDKICDCTIEKQHWLAFPQASKHRSDHGLDLLHTDLCGPIKPVTTGGNQ